MRASRLPVARLPAGWPIVAGGFGVMLVSGVLWNTFGLFLVALEEEFGWSRGEISFGFTLFTLLNAGTSPLVGYAFRHIDARLVLGALSAVLALGLWGVSRIETLAGFYLTFGLVCGIGAQCCSSFALFTILGNWFRGKATLLSIADSGSGIGAFIGLPIVLVVMEGSGWRGGFAVLVPAVAAVVLPLNAWLMRLEPPQAPTSSEPKPVPSTGSPSQWQLVCLGAAFFLGPFAYQALLTQQIALFHDKGVPPSVAVWIAAVVGLSVFACRFVAGWLIDRLGAGTVLRLGLGGAVLTVLCLQLLISFDIVAFLYAYPVLLGAGFGAQAIVLAGGTRAIVPSAEFTVVFGTMRLVGGFGIALGPVLAGVVFDSTNSYQLPVLMILAAIIGQYYTFCSALDTRNPPLVVSR